MMTLPAALGLTLEPLAGDVSATEIGPQSTEKLTDVEVLELPQLFTARACTEWDPPWAGQAKA